MKNKFSKLPFGWGSHTQKKPRKTPAPSIPVKWGLYRYAGGHTGYIVEPVWPHHTGMAQLVLELAHKKAPEGDFPSTDEITSTWRCRSWFFSSCRLWQQLLHGGYFSVFTVNKGTGKDLQIKLVQYTLYTVYSQSGRR